MGRFDETCWNQSPCRRLEPNKLELIAQVFFAAVERLIRQSNPTSDAGPTTTSTFTASDIQTEDSWVVLHPYQQQHRGKCSL